MRANLSAIAVAVVGLGLLAGPPVVLAGGWDDRRFSTAERRALLSGELVQRRVRQRRSTHWNLESKPALPGPAHALRESEPTPGC